MRRGSWVGAVVLVSAVLCVAIAWTSRPEYCTVPQPTSSGSTANAPAVTSEVEPVPAPVQRDDATTEPATRAPTGPAPASGAVDATPTRVTCRVLEATDHEPVADAVVTLKSPKLANPLVFECDENGEFDVELTELSAAFGDAVGIVVRDGDGHMRLRDSLTLAPEVTLNVPASLVLRGEVVLPGLLSPEGLNVSIWTSQANAGERFIGNQTLEEDGRFLVRGSPVRVPDAFVVRVDRGGIPTSVRVPTEELTSPAGARVEVALTRLAITVLDDVDAPVARATVRVSLTTPGPGVTSRIADTSTGEDGIGHVWVAAGPVGVVAGAPRHTAESEDTLLTGGEGQVTIRLRRLSADDVLHGRVELDDGTPAPGAHVAAWFARDDGALSSTSTVQQPADVEGAFDLAIATDRELVVTATHKALGGSDRVRWQPGGGPVRLVIHRGGTVVVQAQGLPARAADSGDIQVALVGPKGQLQAIGTDELPITFTRLEPGAWRVFSVAEGVGVWAVGEARVETGRSTTVTLVFDRLQALTGSIVRAGAARVGTDTQVEFAPPGWPEVAVESLLRRNLSEDGTFRVPGPSNAGELRVRVPGKMVERRPARVGAPLDITLPE